MPTREVFGRLCRRVCEQQAWRLLPSGVQVSLPDGRTQLVGLEFFENGRDELVRLYTTIGSAEALSPQRLALALRINADLAHGALAIKDDELVMVDTLLLKDANAPEIEASISFLAATADYYERTIYGTDAH